LASNRITATGLKAVLDAARDHPSLVLLDFGFTRATAAVGELGNRLGDAGALLIADFLKHNKKLRRSDKLVRMRLFTCVATHFCLLLCVAEFSLDLMHNAITQTGINAIRDALQTNTTLTTLNCAQYGKVHSEAVKAEIAALLERNKKLAVSIAQLSYFTCVGLSLRTAAVYRTTRPACSKSTFRSTFRPFTRCTARTKPPFESEAHSTVISLS
jgi:hypothetical protein